jgi:hypothetical protein
MAPATPRYVVISVALRAPFGMARNLFSTAYRGAGVATPLMSSHSAR